MLTMSTYCGVVISLSAERAMDDAQHRLAQTIRRVSWSREPSRTVSLGVSNAHRLCVRFTGEDPSQVRAHFDRLWDYCARLQVSKGS